MRGKWIAVSVVGVLALVAVGAAWMLLRNRAPAAPMRTAGAVSMPVGTGMITVTGTIRAQHVVTFGPTVKGNVEAFMAEVGDEVSEGQTLARIGATSLEADRENAETAVQKAQDRFDRAQGAVNAARLEESRAAADLEKARAVLQQSDETYAKQKTRIDAGAISRQSFERSSAEHQAAQNAFDVMDKAWRAASDNIKIMQDLADQAKAPLDAALQRVQDVQANLDATEVRAPVDGWLVVRQGQLGQPADTYAEDMFQIATDLASLEVVVDPKAEALKKILPGMQTLVLVPEITDAAISGDVKTVQDKDVIVEFISGMPSILPGMKADVRFKLD